MTHPQTTARLNAIEGNEITDGSRSRFAAEVKRAIQVGFSEREAPFAASARLSRGPTTVARMRTHLQASFPSLYRDEAA